MKKKQIEQLDEKLIKNIEYNDSVLDLARETLNNLNNEKESYSSAYTPKKVLKTPKKGMAGTITKNAKIGIIGAICAIFFIAIIICVFYLPSVGFENHETYNLSELDKSKIVSVAEYNEDNNTNYLYMPDVESETILYSFENTAILITDTFIYENNEYIWYIIFDNSNNINGLDMFDDLYNTLVINDNTIYFNIQNGILCAKTDFENSRYCLYTETGTDETLYYIFSKIL